MIKYKILEEYPTYYLCEHPRGWKECFQKMGVKIEEDNGVRYVVKEIIIQEREGLDSEKVNHSFNKNSKSLF